MPKVARDPGAPKRNQSAYLLYQNAMREHFKAQNPGMTFGQLSKYTSAMYADLSEPEKETWVAQAEADKVRYNQELSTYVPPPGYDHKGDAMTGSTLPQQQTQPKRPRSDKDSGAPKRNVSAYLHYQNAMRDKFKSENPGMSFGQLSKYTSHMYKNLSPEERAYWVKRAKEDRERYIREMASYVPPPAYDANGNPCYGSSIKRGRKIPRDPSAPKRARGSFVFFTFDMRPKITKEFPGIKFVEMGTILGERWRALSPEEKKKYEDMAAEDKIRFHKEMQKYPGAAQNRATQIQQVKQKEEPREHFDSTYDNQEQHYNPTQEVQQQSKYDATSHRQHQRQYDPTQHDEHDQTHREQQKHQQPYDPAQHDQQQRYDRAHHGQQQQQQYHPLHHGQQREQYDTTRQMHQEQQYDRAQHGQPGQQYDAAQPCQQQQLEYDSTEQQDHKYDLDQQQEQYDPTRHQYHEAYDVIKQEQTQEQYNETQHQNHQEQSQYHSTHRYGVTQQPQYDMTTEPHQHQFDPAEHHFDGAQQQFDSSPQFADETQQHFQVTEQQYDGTHYQHYELGNGGYQQHQM